jgi:AraC-like DNA-binding protein
MHHLLEALGSMGLDADALCREAGIAPDYLRDSGYRIDARALVKILSAAESQTADRLVGLHAGERVRFGSLASYLVGSQNTVADALDAQSRFQMLVLGANAIAVQHRDQATYVTLESGSPPAHVRHLTEYCITSSCRLMRWLTLQAARPSEIHFRHSPGGELAEYERSFGCRVQFNMPENGALLSRTALAEPLLSANEELAAQLERLAREEIGTHAAAAFRDAVACALRAGGMIRARRRREVIARRLGVSPRTLQRRLETEGTSFGEVLDETRRRVALELIADPTLSIGDVSRGVGYADQFAFNKAFRRWTGRSPSAYRREAPRRAAP